MSYQLITLLLTYCRDSSKVKEIKRGKKESTDWHKTESLSPYMDVMVCYHDSLIYLFTEVCC